MMDFEAPGWLVVIPLIVLALLLARRLRRPRKSAHLSVPDAELFTGLPVTLRERLQHVPLIVRTIAVLLAAVALARPVAVRGQTVNRMIGLDVMILLDVSRSMAAEDFAPNRLGSARQAAERIVTARPHDRFGVISFANDVQMNTPLTGDHVAVVTSLRHLAAAERFGGTALGDAIAHGVNALRGTASTRRVMLLFSDGGTNAGRFDPISAASLAAHFGITIYAVGIGSQNPAPFPTQFGQVLVKMPFDAALLSKIATTANGRVFSITDETTPASLGQELGRLEPRRTLSEQRFVTMNLGYFFAAMAALFAGADIVFAVALLNRLP